MSRVWPFAVAALGLVALVSVFSVPVSGQGAPLFQIPLTKSVEDENKFISVLLSLRFRQRQAILLQTNATAGEVPLEQEVLSDKHLATYYGTVKVGDTKFRILFDTGSCEFWVPSTECDTERCQRHNRYPMEEERFKSNSEDEDLKDAMNIQYLSGKVQGDMIHETVTLGDIVVKRQVVGIARVVDIVLLDDVVWDGILGLAYANPVLTEQGVVPLFDNMKESGVLSKAGLSNQFAYYIDDYKGAITFGGANCELIAPGEDDASCVKQFQFVPVTEKTYWTIKISDVRIKYPDEDETSGYCDGEEGCKAIVDTGTYLIYGPEDQVSGMMTSEIKSCEHHRKMPTITFELWVGEGMEPVALTLRPIDYILKFEINDVEECVVGISPDHDTIWTLGQVFLRSYYTIFDRDEDRIGFAHIKRDKFDAITPSSDQEERTSQDLQEVDEEPVKNVKVGEAVDTLPPDASDDYAVMEQEDQTEDEEEDEITDEEEFREINHEKKMHLKHRKKDVRPRFQETPQSAGLVGNKASSHNHAL